MSLLWGVYVCSYVLAPHTHNRESSYPVLMRERETQNEGRVLIQYSRDLFFLIFALIVCIWKSLCVLDFLDLCWDLVLRVLSCLVGILFCFDLHCMCLCFCVCIINLFALLSIGLQAFFYYYYYYGYEFL